MERVTPESALIVGFGYAGRRFARALRHLASAERNSVSLDGIYDVSPQARALAAGVAPVFEDLDTAMRTVRPDLVVVAVNEERHGDVLRQIADYRLPLIVCEKPLTATLEEALGLPAALAQAPLVLNFVERQSSVLEPYRAWAAEQVGLRPLRVEFWWGKHRVADARPTMGVLSELAHPLDLVDHLFGLDAFEILHVHGLASDFSPHHDRALDTVSIVASAGDYVLVGSSSFAWPRRVRVLTAVLTNEAGDVFRATVDFDVPVWDCDHLRLAQVDPLNGSTSLVLDVATANGLFPSELFGVAKIASLLRDSLALARTGVARHPLAGYEQALKVQRILEALDRRLCDDALVESAIIGDGRPTLDRVLVAAQASPPPLVVPDLGA